MSNRPHHTIPQDVQQLADDFGQLAGDLRGEAEQAAEDALGAQFVAATDLVESVGTGVEFVPQFGEILRYQGRLAAGDFEQLTRALLAGRTPTDAVAAIRDHVARRLVHTTEGISAWFELGVEVQKELSDIHQGVWGAFMRSARQHT